VSRLGIGRSDYETDGFRLADLDPDPLNEVRRWIAMAVEAGEPQPDAMGLATVDAGGRPSVRSVLLKAVDIGFVFYTNYDSRKGRDLAATGVAALHLTWATIHRQVRAEGGVERITEEQSDAYWRTRPRGAQLAAAASAQSTTISGRDELERAMAALETDHANTEIPRPAHWGGFRLVPDAIELWQGRRNRMHDRALYTRRAEGWTKRRLSP
jgi:pyridoxamine 5'-phosphate oxidase